MALGHSLTPVLSQRAREIKLSLRDFHGNKLWDFSGIIAANRGRVAHPVFLPSTLATD